MDDDAVHMRDCVIAVEQILHYRFKDMTLLEKALTHSSYIKSESYERLEFVGDSALGLAVTNYIYLAYPDVTPGDLSSLRAANINTEKLARVAVRHCLYMYMRLNAASLEDKVREFCEAVQEEDDIVVVYGGAMKAPKVLADIVEAVAAAVYIDEGFDLQKMWQVVKGLLEPLITLDMLIEKPQPVTKLFEACQKNGKRVDIKQWREGDKNFASVYIDDHLIVSVSSDQKENAKLQAAKAALQKLALHGDKVDICSSSNESGEIEAAKQKLHEICGKKKWPKPIYSDKQVEEGVPAKRKAVFLKVNDLKPGTKGHNLTVKVVSSTTVLDKKSISNVPAAAKTRIAECLIGDDTGSILFTARNQQVDLMKPGATVIIRNSKIDMFKGSMRLAVDKWGRIEVAEPAKFYVKEDNNLSLVEYELVNDEV